MVCCCGVEITSKEKLPKTAEEPAPGSAHTGDGEQEQILPLHARRETVRGKTVWGKPPLTPRSCSDLGPGRGGESRSLPCSLPLQTGGQGVGGQRGGGLSLGRGSGLAVCSGRLVRIANCCHSQEEGRRRTEDYDSGVFRVVQAVPGMLSQPGQPMPHAAPGSHSVPSAHGSNRCSAVPGSAFWYLLSCASKT